MRKYLARAAKYFVWFAVIFVLIIAVLIVTGLAEGSVEEMFRDGYKSLAEIAVLFLVVAAIYPKFGFTAREVYLKDDSGSVRDGIISCMESRGYSLENEDGDKMTFRLRSKVSAFFKMLEDRITITREPGSLRVEGLTKEVTRVVSSLEHKFADNAQ